MSFHVAGHGIHQVRQGSGRRSFDVSRPNNFVPGQLHGGRCTHIPRESIGSIKHDSSQGWSKVSMFCDQTMVCWGRCRVVDVLKPVFHVAFHGIQSSTTVVSGGPNFDVSCPKQMSPSSRVAVDVSTFHVVLHGVNQA